MGAKQDVTIEVDKSRLQTAIDAAKALKAENYTAETWEVLTTKLAAAEKVYADPEATDYEVLLAIANLTEAIEGLEAVETPEAGDKTELNNLITQYSGLNEKDYTAESWKVFANALENAKAVSAKENASQAEIDQAIAALTSARAGLVKATDQTTQADKSKLPPELHLYHLTLLSLQQVPPDMLSSFLLNDLLLCRQCVEQINQYYS